MTTKLLNLTNQAREKSRTSYLIDWYSGSGSQEYLINKIVESDVLLVKQYQGKGHFWGITSKENLKKVISKNRGIYEIIMERKHKLYFDIDADRPVLDSVKKIITELIPDAELSISGSEVNTEFLKKYSYHIVVNNYYLHNTLQSAGVRQFCKENKEFGFDPMVYTKNRAMKCINQSKPDGRIQEIIENKKIEDHLITAYFPDNMKDAYEIFKEYEEFSEEPLVVNLIKQERRKVDYGINIDKQKHFSTEIDILRLIPPDHDHIITFQVARFLFNLGTEFNAFWEFRMRKCIHNNDSPATINQTKKKWEDKWKNIQFTDICFKDIIKILRRYYTNIDKSYYERLYFDYSTPDVDKYITEQFLNVDSYTDKRVDYLITPMGSNKTGSLIDLLKRDYSDSKVIFLNVRKTLAANLTTRIGSEYTNYDDLSALKKIIKSKTSEVDYLTFTKSTTKIKQKSIPLIDKLITTPNSLHYSKNVIDKYDVLVIDEVESFHHAWLGSKTHNNNYTTNWECFTKLLSRVKKIILLDALYSHNTIRLLERYGIKRSEISIISSTFVYPKMNLIDHKNNDKFLSVLIDKIIDNKKVYVFWPFKTIGFGAKKRISQFTLLELIKKHIKDKQPTREIKAIIYNAETTENKDIKQTLKNINKYWSDLDIVITGQSITVGVNYDVPDIYDSVFIADASFVSMRDIVQTSRRIRHLKSNDIHYTNLNAGSYSGYERDTELAAPKEYLDDILAEKKAKSESCVFNMFSKNNIVIDERKYKINKDFITYKKEIIKNKEDVYDYDRIPDINDSEDLERLFTCGAGTFEDCLKLIKYRFKLLFKSKNEMLIKEAWEYRQQLYYLRKITPDLNDIFKKCGGDLNAQGRYITDKERITLIKNFSFSEINNESKCDAKILSESFNIALGMKYYCYNKNSKTYEISDRGAGLTYVLEALNDDVDEDCIFDECEDTE